MTKITRMTMMMLAGAALPLLAACGANDIASPGDGTVVPPDTTPPVVTPPVVGPNQASTAPLSQLSPQLASFVSAQGAVDEGVIEFGAATTSAGSATAQAVVSAFRVIRLPGLIDRDTTLPYVPGVAYLIDGRVNVGSDLGGDATGAAAGGGAGVAASLTIEPGAILFADNGASGSLTRVTANSDGSLNRQENARLNTSGDADYMIVNRGSKLFANGSATRPIIFTARQNLEGTAQDSGERSQGLWGGVILAGRAPISDCTGTGIQGGAGNCYRIVEGTTTARYGGSIADDSSGSLRYVQIRYSGIAITEGQELQGLTPAGVGSGTVIDHVQVHNSADDGVEIFGGRVNAKYLVITGADDDDLDTDVGYQGAIQFVLGVKREGNGSSDPRNLEVDSSGNEDAGPRQYLRLANFTFYHDQNSAQALYLRGGADATLVNGIVKSRTRACIDIDGSQTVRAADSTIVDAAGTPSPDRGPPAFHSMYFECTTGVENDGETGNLTAAAVEALFTAGTNNVLAGSASLTATFLPGSASPALSTAFDASTLNRTGETFLVATTYIGAVSDANDNWYKGWTCTPSYLSGQNGAGNLSGLGACTSIPSYS